MRPIIKRLEEVQEEVVRGDRRVSVTVATVTAHVPRDQPLPMRYCSPVRLERERERMIEFVRGWVGGGGPQLLGLQYQL